MKVIGFYPKFIENLKHTVFEEELTRNSNIYFLKGQIYRSMEYLYFRYSNIWIGAYVLIQVDPRNIGPFADIRSQIFLNRPPPKLDPPLDYFSLQRSMKLELGLFNFTREKGFISEHNAAMYGRRS